MYLPLLPFSIILSNVLAPPLPPSVANQNAGLFKLDRKVALELAVMSQCPDALICESVINEVLPKVANKVNLTLHYIGEINPDDHEFGVTCLHGPVECAGNIQQLCVAKYAPSSETWWEFVQCQNRYGRYKVGLPDVAWSCAKAVGLDWKVSGVGQCVGLDVSGRGKEGIELLRESVEETRALGVYKSCTILIGRRQVCIRDGTWKSCEEGHSVADFVRQINEEYERLNRLI